MHKIIHSSFEFDLTNYKISTVEDNHWFNDQFFTKYSFPFNVYLTDELIKVFGEFLDDNVQFLVTYFEVKYLLHNSLENATLEITSQRGKQLTFEVRYGFDELPNFNKKLAELPLEVTAITDIYAHAKTIIPQTWPAVNYNYPQIHTDKYDETEITWSTFKKIINNYIAGEFLVNTYLVEDFSNRNIIQPLPYFLHILTAGFLDAGYILKGDVTTNPNFLKLCLFSDIDYFEVRGNIVDFKVLKSEHSSIIDTLAFYNNTHDIVSSSTYKITGTATCHSIFRMDNWQWTYSQALIKYKGTTLFSGGNIDTQTKVYNIDVTFTTNADVSEQSLLFEAMGSLDGIDGVIFDLKIERVLENAPSEIRLYNEVNLKNVVPDMTFGTFISVLKNWFNIDLTILGKDIYMNFIENEINYDNATKLKEYEVMKPQRQFNNDISFLLKFADVDSEAYKYDVIFQNKDGFEISDVKVNKQTNTINIEALPLPQKYVNGVETAFAFDHGGNAKIYAVLYDGLNSNGLNLTKDITPVLIPSVHQNHYRKWFTFRIFAITYQWKFKMWAESLSEIKKKIYAYGRYHIIKTINKTQISEDLFEVDIESDTLN